MTKEATPAQVDQCTIVEQEVVELINRLAVEGFDYRIILAGVSSATAASVCAFLGPKEVPVWFARQAAMTMHLAKAAGG